MALVRALTDGSGIGEITASKVFKDFVVDFLLTAGAALAAANVVGVPTDRQSTVVIAIAVANAAAAAVFRAVLKWASS